MTGRNLTRPASALGRLRTAGGSSRGWIAALVIALLALPAFAVQPSGAQPHQPQPWGVCAPGVLIAGYSDSLNGETFEGTAVGGLSALAFDEDRGVYYALVDNAGEGESARFYTLSIARPTSSGFGGATVQDVTTLEDSSGVPFDESNFDGEGIAVLGRGTLLVSSETEPSIREFSRSGLLLRELRIPERFLIEPEGQGQANASLEGLTVSPNGRVVYSANEDALLNDGEGQIRFLRHDWVHYGVTSISSQYYYQTEPGQVVGEILAVSETELLVLERSWVEGYGNTIRIFLTSTAGAPDVSDVDSLDGAGIDPLPKQLLVDIVNCPPGDAPNPQMQPNPLLDNFEGMALGPLVNGGYQSLYLLSDDNFNANQLTRIIALAIDPELLDGSVFVQ